MSTPESPAPMSSPDITSMQKIVGAVTAIIPTAISVAVAFDAHVTLDQGAKILGLWVALGAFAVTADAIIRQGRAKAHAAITIAAAAAAQAPAPVVRTTARRKPAARKPAPTSASIPGAGS